MFADIISTTVAAVMFGRGGLNSFPLQRDEHLIMVLRYVFAEPGACWVVEHSAGMTLVKLAATASS